MCVRIAARLCTVIDKKELLMISKHRELFIFICMLLIVPLAGEPRIHPFGNEFSSFRVSFGSPMFLLFLLWIRNVPMAISGLAVGIAVVLFRGALDAVGGAALSAAAVLVVAWVLGVAVSGSALPGLTGQVRSSVVLAKVDEVMPDAADDALSAFNEVVGSSFFPQYLEPFAPERIIEVGPPSDKVARDPQVRAAAESVLKIRGENSCGRGVEGTGFVYSPGRVMTTAATFSPHFSSGSPTTAQSNTHSWLPTASSTSLG